MISSSFRTHGRGESAPEIECAFGVELRSEWCAVFITGSRDVSDPRTDPGARVPVPEGGSLAPRLLFGAGRSRGERRRAIVYRC